MKQGTPHRLLAWALDICLLVAAGRIVSKAFTPDAPRMLLLSGILIAFILPTLYHLFWAARTRFLSFGEHVFARVVVEGRKSWINPYGSPRVLLYGAAAYGVFLRFSIFPKQSVEIPVELLLLAIAAVSVVAMGRGHAWALMGIVAFRALQRTASMPSLSFDSLGNVLWFTLGVHGETILFAAFCAAVAHGYSAARGRALAAQQVAA